MIVNLKIRKLIFLFIVIFLLLTFSFTSIQYSNAQYNYEKKIEIDMIAAKIVAENKLVQLKKPNFIIINESEIYNENGKKMFYVFDLLPQGYIVVTANKYLPPVIAYSFFSSFENELLEENILKNILISDIELRINNIHYLPDKIINTRINEWNKLILKENEYSDKNVFKQWPQEGTSISGGWIETKWDQTAPFNNFCPIDKKSGNRGVAGCPAVAMAQILNYHQTINNIEFNDSDDYLHSYKGNNFWIDDQHEEYNFPSFPALNAYLDTLVDHWRNNIQLTDEDKAAINFACGIAAQQVYHPNGSGTFGVNQAFNAYQRFNFDDVELLTESNPDLYDRLSSNMMDALPAHLAIVNEEMNSGHNLVVDGYNTEGFYHLNFGWGGYYDGWYLLPDDLPMELTVIEGIIVSINDENSGSYLDGSGALYWTNAKQKSTLTGNFSIVNIGLPGSEIDWEIVVWPDWGTWTFTPDSGEDLTPEDGSIMINVEVDVSVGLKKYFNGHVKVVNINNLDDYCLIHVSLTKHHIANIYFSQFLHFINNILKIPSFLIWVSSSHH